MGADRRLSRLSQVAIVVFGYAWVGLGVGLLHVLAAGGTPPDVLGPYVSWPIMVWFAVPTAVIVWWHWERVPPSRGARVVFAVGLCFMMETAACATTRAFYAALVVYERGSEAVAVLVFAAKFVEVLMVGTIALAVLLGGYALFCRRKAE